MNRVEVVVSSAGRDSGRMMAVLNEENGYCFLADGKERSIAKPKRKNVKHIARTPWYIDRESLLSDKSLRRALKHYKE